MCVCVCVCVCVCYILNFNYPGGWSDRIHRPHLCRGVKPPPNNLMVRFQLWEMRSTPSLPSLPGPLTPGIVAPGPNLWVQ